MTDELEATGNRSQTMHRRRLLQTVGAGAVGLIAFSGLASAHQSQFFGCSQVCSDTDGECTLCLNPNRCVQHYYDDPQDILEDLNDDDTCVPCEGSVVLGRDCAVYGSNGASGGRPGRSKRDDEDEGRIRRADEEGGGGHDGDGEKDGPEHGRGPEDGEDDRGTDKDKRRGKSGRRGKGTSSEKGTGRDGGH